MPITSAVALNGSPSTESTTARLVTRACELAGGDTVVHLADLPAEGLLARTKDQAVADVITALISAPILIVGTPIYRATYSGLLKLAFDLMPERALARTACVLVATAASERHYLSVDTSLRSMVASVGAWSVPTAVYATKSDVNADGFSARLEAELRQAIAEATEIVSVHKP
jgi:FMN reductase